ncbi:TIGR03086 family metal-binding protein [Streptosporangium sp. CA-135522]|uniref:TIGR03086 family metal-binding protein n=1 Tax=Streptosporangium sp. CA-135522 TaxID=3240072 RepID=UPI003D8E4253
MDAIDGHKLVADAHGYLRAVTLGVPRERWGNGTPCPEWTARQVLNHARIAQLAYEAAITGGDGQPPINPFDPADAFDRAPADELDEVLVKVSAAWSTLSPDTETAPTPMGPMPLWVGAGACALDAGVHAWDVAVATGQNLPLPEDLAERLIPVAERIVGRMREEWGFFGPALDASAVTGTVHDASAVTGTVHDASAVTGPVHPVHPVHEASAATGSAATLLRYLGRDPRWSPAT